MGAGEIPLGGLVQTATAFSQVQDSLSFIVSSYTDIAEWRAVVERIAGFERALERTRVEAMAQGGIARMDGDGARLVVKNLEIDRPDGQPLVAGVKLVLGGYPRSLNGSTRPATGRCGCLPVSSSASPLRARSSSGPIGSSSTRRPRPWTRRRNTIFIGCCARGSPEPPCSAWGTGRGSARSTSVSCSCSPTGTDPSPSSR